MVNFRELWESVITDLKNHSVFLEVDDTKILKGDPAKFDPVNPPSIYVYCLPGSTELPETEWGVMAKAVITVFCSVAPAIDGAEALNLAMELAGRVLTVLKDSKPLSQSETFEPEFVNSTQDYTTVALPFTAFYDPYIEEVQD